MWTRYQNGNRHVVNNLRKMPEAEPHLCSHVWDSCTQKYLVQFREIHIPVFGGWWLLFPWLWQTYKSRNKPQWSYEQVICQIWNTKIYSKVFSCLNNTQIEKLDFRQFFHLMLKSFTVFKPSACSYLLPDSFLWLSWCRLEFLLLQSQMICYWFCFEPEVMIWCWQRL